MLYILSYCYEPNSAPLNHALSLVKGISEAGVKAEWVFIIPHWSMARWENPYQGIKVRYLWNNLLSRNRYVRHIYKHFSYAWFYFFKLKRGDTVLLLGASSYLHWLVRKRGVHVFHERTEHPQAVEVHGPFRRSYNNDCAKADGIFVITAALKEYFESVGVPSRKVSVINMVVDSHRFKDLNHHTENRPYIGYCGNGANVKDGVDDLIRAFAIVAEKDQNIHLLIIGQAPSNDSSNRKLVVELGLENRVEFTGVLPASEVPQLLFDATMLVLCRPNSLQNKYGFPTKLGEYLLTGNPVIVTRVGDIPLFLEHEKSAMLSVCRDVQGFADNMLWVLEHPKEAKLIGQGGKKVAEQHFNYKVESKKMLDVMYNDKTE